MDRTVTVEPEPLTVEAFEPFGQVFGPDRARTTGFYANTSSRRLGFSMQDEEVRLIVVDSAYVPWTFHAMERHFAITQTFVPLDGAPNVMVVAAPTNPDDPDDIPKPGQIRAFHMDGSQSVLLWRGTWHALASPFPARPAGARYLLITGLETDRELRRHDRDGTPCRLTQIVDYRSTLSVVMEVAVRHGVDAGTLDEL